MEAAGISLASALEIYNREKAKRKNKIWAFAIVLVAKASQFQHRLIKKLPPLYVSIYGEQLNPRNLNLVLTFKFSESKGAMME